MKKLVAIVYDRVNKWGGAERVLLALHEIFPDAPLYTSVYDPEGAPWAQVFPKVYTSFLQRVPFARTNHEFIGTFMPLAFGLFDLSKYDGVISVTSEAAKCVRVGSETFHICYCLTPTRYLWSHHDLYFRNPVLWFFSRPAVWLLRWWDRKATGKPNEIVAISGSVKRRIKKYYGRNSRVIFPPVSPPTNRFIGSKAKRQNNKKYYLLVSRLDYGYKKVDLVINTFNRLGKPLIIVGTGRTEKKLKKMANKNIRFVGKVTDAKLMDYYLNAKALIMPQEEDFGIVAVEAQALGTPVIAFAKGGALDTVIDGKTGIFFPKQTAYSLIKAIHLFEKKKFVINNLYTNAKRFSKDIFKQKILALIQNSLEYKK